MQEQTPTAISTSRTRQVINVRNLGAVVGALAPTAAVFGGIMASGTEPLKALGYTALLAVVGSSYFTGLTALGGFVGHRVGARIDNLLGDTYPLPSFSIDAKLGANSSLRIRSGETTFHMYNF